MKKVIRKYWGIVLVVVMLSTLFIAAAPTSAADPLKWNMDVTYPMYIPGLVYTQYPGTDIQDFAVSGDGMTYYVAITDDGMPMITITTAFAGDVDGLAETFNITYVDQNGVPGNAGTIAITPNAPLGLDFFAVITLAAGDTGIRDIQNIAVGAPNDATAGAFSVATSVALGSCTFAGVFTDGVTGNKLMKGTMGGAVWTDLTSATNNRVPPTLDAIDYVAISPDNPDIVVILDTGGADTLIKAAASQDGGLNFYDMGTIQGAGGNAIVTANDLAVSPVSANNIYYVAIAGTDGAGPGTAAIYYYNFGAAVGAWREAVDDFGTAAVTPAGTDPTVAWAAAVPAVVPTTFLAVDFSTQFGSDFTVLAISQENAGLGLDRMLLHIFSLASHKWDTDLNMMSYPVPVDTEDNAGAFVWNVRAASIATGPDFMGLEEETTIVFVGASILDDGTETGGIYRIDETGTVTVIRTTGIYSIAFDGTTLAAGSYTDNNVWRTLDVTVNQPVAASARSLKRIGVDDQSVAIPNDMVIVHYAGDTLCGAKRGAASALSKSTDYGNTWNDFTLIDSANVVISDIMFAPDGSTWYMAAYDFGEASVYRISATGSCRVLCVAQAGTSPNFMLRGIPDDADVVYAADKTGGGMADIYVTSDGGLVRWSRKTTYPGAIINDLCVESATVVYAATGTLIYKSTNSGSLWSAGVDTAISGGVFNMICLGDGKLVAGGGSVVFSTDGGATWTPTLFTAEMGTTLYVAATGLSPTDYIYAASTATNNVYRAPAVFFGEFKTMNVPATATAEVNTGMVLVDGILYVMQTDVGAAVTYMYHTLTPTIGVHTAALWGTKYGSAAVSAYTMNTVPGSALKIVSTGTSYKLYGIDTAGAFGPGIYYFEDIVSPPAAAPVLIGPPDGTLLDIVSVYFVDAEQVVFSWTRANPQITGYTLFVALDEGFTEMAAGFPLAVASTGPGDTVTSVQGRGTFNPGVTHYWRVSVTLPFSGGFSETRSFTVAPGAAIVPTIGSPINGASDVSETPAFSWSAVSGTTMYEFQLSEGTAFAVPMVSEQVATTAIVPNVELTAGKTYFWRVRALEPVESDWSSIGSFTVAVPAEEPPPPITVTTTPPPQITVTTPAPPPALTFTPPAEEKIAPAYIWAIIIIGAVLVIAVIVLIVRTRRSV